MPSGSTADEQVQSSRSQIEIEMAGLAIQDTRMPIFLAASTTTQGLFRSESMKDYERRRK